MGGCFGLLWASFWAFFFAVSTVVARDIVCLICMTINLNANAANELLLKTNSNNDSFNEAYKIWTLDLSFELSSYKKPAS